jgi:mannan endo-1,4-beta-mannosidase
MSVINGCLLGIVVVAVALMPHLAAAQGAPTVYWGALVNGAPADTTRLDQFEANAGKRVSIVHWGQPWKINGVLQSFQTTQYEAVRLRGSIPMINWDSWERGSDVNDHGFGVGTMTLAEVYNGDYDAYVTRWAQDAKAWGHPFFLRFDHELNGYWYPWNEQMNGNKPGDYVKAWRHVVDIFRSVGATNATWVWCVNIEDYRTTPLPQVYPGDDYVDWTAMDGYNVATDASSWLWFGQVFGMNPWGHHNTYQDLLKVAPSKPIMIAETATTIAGGDPAAWIKDAFLTQLPWDFPRVKAVVWFNWNCGKAAYTYPIESSPTGQAAFRQSIASTYYATNTFSSLPAGPICPLGQSWQQSSTLKNVADTYIDAAQPGSTAGGPSLSLLADGDPTRVAFLRFDLSSLAGKSIDSAALRIHTTSAVGAGSNASFDIMYVPSNTWSGATMSMNHSVPISPTRLGVLASPSLGGTWYRATLVPTGVQIGAGGLLSMAVTTSSADGVFFNSKEGDPSMAPQLVVTYH